MAMEILTADEVGELLRLSANRVIAHRDDRLFFFENCLYIKTKDRPKEFAREYTSRAQFERWRRAMLRIEYGA